MKKIITLVLVITMLVVSGISVFAAPEGFVQSPTDDTPSLESYDNESSDCSALVIVTPYSETNELDDSRAEANKNAYNDIINNDDDFEDAMADLAKKENRNKDDLAVSELFDVRYEETEGHDEHGTFTITVKAKNLDNYVGLLQYKDGEWVVVENTKVDGDNLTFTVMDLSQFAIVVDTGDGANVPQIPNTDVMINNMSTQIWVYAAMAFTSLVMIVALVIKQKKIKE